MPQNVTDVDAFTTPVTAAADGDAVNGANFLAVMQGYANRTKYLSNRVETYAQYLVSASSIADAALFTLAADIVSTGTGTWTLASNAVQVPAAGIYQASLSLAGLTSSDATNPKQITVSLLCGAVGFAAGAFRFSATTTNGVLIALTDFFNITTPSTQKFSVRNDSGTGTVSNGGLLSIRRIG